MDLRRVTRWAHNVITKVMRESNATLDIPTIRRQYGATKGQVIELRIGAHTYRNWVRLTDRGIEFVPRPSRTNAHGDKVWNGDSLLEFRDYVTLVDLIRGQIQREDPKTRRKRWDPFDPMSAWFFGYIRTYGDKSSNETLHFLMEVWPKIRERLRSDLGITQ